MPARIVERHHGTVLISTDPTRVDVAAAHTFLTDSYLAEGRSFATQQPAIDVYVLPEARSTGLGIELVRTIVEHPDVAGVRWQFLATADAHDLDARFGFEPLAEPDRWMHRHGSI